MGKARRIWPPTNSGRRSLSLDSVCVMPRDCKIAAEFWVDEGSPQMEEGPIKKIDPDKVPKEPPAMYEGFEWVTMDLTDEKEVSLLPGCDSVRNLTKDSSRRSTTSYATTTLKITEQCSDSTTPSPSSTGAPDFLSLILPIPFRMNEM